MSAYGGGATDVRPPLQDMLGIGLTEVVVVDDARWAELVAPVAPLTLDNPDAVEDFPAGPLSLAADQVGPYLAARNDGESDLARLFRQQLLFEAWVDAVAESSDASGRPRRAGLGHRALRARPGRRAPARSPRSPSRRPRQATESASTSTTDAAASLLATLVPFPTASHPGARTRVRLLDGTGDAQHVITAAPLIVPAGS